MMMRDTKKIEEFLKKVENEAYAIGLDFFIVVNGGMTRANNLFGDVDVQHAIQNYTRFHKSVNSVITFTDLLAFAKQANVNKDGLYINPDDVESLWSMKIIEDLEAKKTKVIVYAKLVVFHRDDETDNEKFVHDEKFVPLVSFTFDENIYMVTITPYDDEIPDYGKAFAIPTESVINGRHATWFRLIHKGGAVKEFLIDTLTPYIVSKEN